MGRFVARRLLWAIALLLLVHLFTFTLFSVLPTADPAALRAGRSGDPQVLAAIRSELGLNESKPHQYLRSLDRLVLHADLGSSYAGGSRAPVLHEIVERLPVTAALTLGAAIVWLIVAVPAGVLAATRSRSLADRVVTLGVLVAVSAPVYWLGLMGLYLFSDDIGTLLPVFHGAGSYVPFADDPSRWLQSFVLPWLVLAASFAAFYTRMLRFTLTETLELGYVRTARAKGARERRVVWRHALPPAMTPLVTMLGVDIGSLLGGAVLVEAVFNLPGIGRLAVNAVQEGDLPVVQGTVLFGALCIVIANLLVDIAYAVRDPRVRVTA
jgi:peptide/nickel transport system permease protein